MSEYEIALEQESSDDWDDDDDPGFEESDLVLKEVEVNGDTITVWEDQSSAPDPAGLTAGETVECPVCDGAGNYRKPGVPFSISCRRCDGTGRLGAAAARNLRIEQLNDAERQTVHPPGEEDDPGIDPIVTLGRGPTFDPTDAAALRLFFKRGAQAEGLTFTQLVRTMPPGRPTAADKRRRDVLARLVAQARDERQARVETIAEVINRPPVTVHQLAGDGRKLAAAG